MILLALPIRVRSGVKRLKVTGIQKGAALLTGGLALDTGLLAAIREDGPGGR